MKSQNKDIPGLIIQKTKQIYRKSYFSKFKKEPDFSATVISSISLLNKANDDVNVISVGFGTKSIPYLIAKQHKSKIIKDMHSQMLAKRGFIAYLVSNLPKKEQQNLIFIWDSKKGKHSMRPQILVILYVNQVFCGDCMTDEQNNLYSGARPLKYFNTKQVPKQQFSQYCLRTKPGRLDLPLDKRSLSLSCSDKVGVWNILGIQGKNLFNYIKPVYIHTIIIQTDHQADQQRIRQGINLVQRIAHISKLSKQSIIKKLFKIVVDNKIRWISSQFKWHQPNLILMTNNKGKDQETNKQKINEIQINSKKQKDNKKLDLCGIISCEQTSWLNGRTGLPQGVSLQKIIKLSPFCSDRLYQKLTSNPNQQFKYHAVKSRIKMLFKEWTDDYKELIK